MTMSTGLPSVSPQIKKDIIGGGGIGASLGLAAVVNGIVSTACPPLFILGCVMVGAGVFSYKDKDSLNLKA